MRLLKMWWVLLCLLSLTITPTLAQAIAVNIVINGTTVSAANCSTAGITTTCNIEGTYGNVVVTGYDPNQNPPTGSSIKPQVILVDDTTLPVLKLVTAKFLASANAVNGSVTFSATPTQGRSNPLMQRTAGGWLGRVEGTSAPYTSPTNRGQFIVDGVVISSSMNPNAESIDGIYNPGGGDTTGSSKVVLSTIWSYGKIDGQVAPFNKTEPMTTLSGSRTLKGEFTFYLPLTNDYLRLNKVDVLTLNSAGTEEVHASVGTTDLWDPDTAHCKCKGQDCKPTCKGKHCPNITDILPKKP